jgi:transposase
MANTSTLTAGIDTSKAKLDVAVHGRPGSFTVANSPAGWTALAARLAEIGVQRVGIEATGGYERGVTRYLQQQGFTVVLLQPLQVKAFAMLRLQRAKSDPIDAGLVAACTFLLDAQNKLPPDPRFDVLTDRLTFIEQTEEDIARLKTRLEHIADTRLLRMAAADIKRLEQRRSLELKRLTAELRTQTDLGRRFELVLSVPGIGERTALALVLRLPELGQVSREQAASLAGLAPFVQQSGKRRGETHIGGGRGRLRRSLYAAALPASFRWNPALRAFYARLVARGHCHKSALVACARKLLVFANTVVARGTPWRDRAAVGAAAGATHGFVT